MVVSQFRILLASSAFYRRSTSPSLYMAGELISTVLLLKRFLNCESAWIGRNLAISMAAGNATIWKPSPSTPLCSIAVTKIVASVLEKNGVPGAVAGLVSGGKDVGEALVQSQDVDMGEGSISMYL
jgi:hypothetical protein